MTDFRPLSTELAGKQTSVLSPLSSVLRLLYSVFCILSSDAFASDVDKYIGQLKDSNEDVRYEAVVALGDLADPAGILPLKEAVGDRAMLVRHAAAESLVQIGGRQVEEIFREFVGVSSVERRRLGAIGLGLIGGGESSFEVLTRLVQDSNWEVRWASLFALGALGDLRAKGVLEKAGGEDSNEEVRKVAKEALGKLAHQIRWYHSLDEGFELGKKLDQKLLVLFQIPSESHCKALRAQLVQPEAVEFCRKFVSVRVNPKLEPEWVERYSIQGVPTLLVLDAQGAILNRIDGLISFEELLSVLRRYSTMSSEMEKWARASQLMDSQDFAGAIPLLEDLSSEGDKRPLISLYLGFSYGKVGQHAKAVNVLESFLAVFPDFEDRDKGLYCLALSYLALGRMEEAERNLNELKARFTGKSTAIAAEEILERIKDKRRESKV